MLISPLAGHVGMSADCCKKPPRASNESREALKVWTPALPPSPEEILGRPEIYRRQRATHLNPHADPFSHRVHENSHEHVKKYLAEWLRPHLLTIQRSESLFSIFPCYFLKPPWMFPGQTVETGARERDNEMVVCSLPSRGNLCRHLTHWSRKWVITQISKTFFFKKW